MSRISTRTAVRDSSLRSSVPVDPLPNPDPIMRQTCSVALATLFLLNVASPAHAQLTFDGIEVSGGYFEWSGDDFLEVEGGVRFVGGPMFRIGDFWQVGAEGYYSTGDVPLLVDPIEIKEYGINAVAKRAFADLRRTHFFVMARGGWNRLTSEIVDSSTGEPSGDFAQNGWSFGPEAGMGFSAGQYSDVTLSVGLNWNSYSDCQVFGPGDFTTGRSCSGIRWGFRIGLALGRQN